ncbi:MAG: hypothetical protein AAGC74_06470 [Verrucomicrobiota bacterium]
MALLRTLLLTLVGASSLPAQSELYKILYNPKTGSSFKVTSMAGQLPPSGYMPIRIEAKNGEKVPLRWTLDFLSADTSFSDNNENRLESSFEIACEPGRRETVEFLVPLVTCFSDAHYNQNCLLEMDVICRPLMISGNGSLYGDFHESWPAVLLSEELFTPNASALDAATKPGLSSRGSLAFGSKFNTSSLSNDWRAYSGFDVFMITADEWRRTSPGAKTAILKWNRLGGRIHLYTTYPSETPVSLNINSDPNGLRSWGQVRTFPLAPQNHLDPSETISRITTSSSGMPPDSKLQILVDQFRSAWPLQAAFGSRSFNPIFFILILIIFGVLVGPINLFVFAKSGQRHKLFLTTPIISLAASLLLLIVILFQDGFGGRGFRLALIEVQPDENTAYLSQTQIARTGVLLNTSFKVTNDAIISPLLLNESRWARVTRTNDGGSGRYKLAASNDNLIRHTGDWFKSRSEYGHLLTSVQPTRGRLELLNSSGPPTLASTFDFDLAPVYYLDSQNQIWTTPKIAKGQRVQLTLSNDKDLDKWVNQQRLRFHPLDSRRLDNISDRSEHFLAASTSAPFIETLGTINWTQNDALIAGPVVRP